MEDTYLAEDTKPCPIHTGAVMYRREGKYGVFFSHKTEAGEWCQGKVSKAQVDKESHDEILMELGILHEEQAKILKGLRAIWSMLAGKIEVKRKPMKEDVDPSEIPDDFMG